MELKDEKIVSDDSTLCNKENKLKARVENKYSS